MEEISGTTFTLTLTDDDGNGTGDNALVTRAIQRASRTIRRHLGMLYDDAALAASEHVNECACVLALCYLSQRRALPDKSYCAQAKEEWIPWLERVRNGDERIPDAAMITDPAPILSNQGYVPGLANPVVVTNSTPSQPAPEYSQNDDPFGGLF